MILGTCETFEGADLYFGYCWAISGYQNGPLMVKWANKKTVTHYISL